MTHAVAHGERDGFATIVLSSPAGLVAEYVPGAGMVLASLRIDEGPLAGELLGQRKGLAAYASGGATMGIPLLAPWANRLGRNGYTAGGTEVSYATDDPLIHRDAAGLPIHGLLAGCGAWEVVSTSATAHAAGLVAFLDVAALDDVMERFPFPHTLRLTATLSGTHLVVTVELVAAGDVAVPVAFGWHPYLSLPGAARPDWEVALGVRRRMQLDPAGLPTGVVEEVEIPPGRLGSRTYDDLFVDVDDGARFVVSDGGLEVALTLADGWRCAQVYAPADDDVVCFEPMTASVDPFATDSGLIWVEPGDRHSATFMLDVSATAPTDVAFR